MGKGPGDIMDLEQEDLQEEHTLTPNEQLKQALLSVVRPSVYKAAGVSANGSPFEYLHVTRHTFETAIAAAVGGAIDAQGSALYQTGDVGSSREAAMIPSETVEELDPISWRAEQHSSDAGEQI